MRKNNNKHEELVEEFMANVGRIMRGMRASFRGQMERYEVTWPQFHLLKAVKHHDGITVNEVSSMMMISAPTASRMLESLRSKGLLEKERDSEDHRVTRLKLSARSEGLMRELTKLQDEIMLEVFKEEDEAELERTINHLSRITERWLKIGEAAAKRSSGE